VVFRGPPSGVRYLILQYNAGHWDFPKGNRERRESSIDTARREIREETGIADVTFVPHFNRHVTYYYRREGELVHKVVEFLLARTVTETVRISAEHLGYLWLPFNQALRRLTFENARDVLRAAHGHITRNPVPQATKPQDPRKATSEKGAEIRQGLEAEPADEVRPDARS
jgi:8-oxo-dGTP pyrophosphatase MutT (NUDIX family)